MRQNMENYIIQVLSYLKITNYLESETKTLDYYVIETSKRSF